MARITPHHLDIRTELHNHVVVDKLSQAFAALADPTRRAILARLSEGPLYVRDLVASFDMTQQAISKHVGVLRRAGLVTQEKQGRLHLCHLRPEPLTEATSWIEKHRALWAERFDSLDRFLASQRDDHGGGDGDRSTTNDDVPADAPAQGAPPTDENGESEA